jgi:Ssp1 endopeptidase immunity protein Rap1a
MRRLLLGALCLIPLGAQADVVTAQQVYEACTSEPNSPPIILCHGFMGGFAQGAYGAQVQGVNYNICLPDDFSGEDLLALFKRTMQTATPDMKATSISPLLYLLLGAQYPCKK